MSKEQPYNENRVQILLRICKNLTEEHIIKTCENQMFYDELTKYDRRDKHFVIVKNIENIKYKLLQTIRIANDIILNNSKKLDVPKYKQGNCRLKSGDFSEFFRRKFGNSDNIRPHDID